MELKAKDNGITLVDHSRLVEMFSLNILEKSLEKNKSKLGKYSEIISFASKIHDIGKCQSDFQNLINTGKSKKKKGKFFHHNEIGWAFLAYHFEHSDRDFREHVLDLVYWHHGIVGRQNDDYAMDIYNTISSEDIAVMKEFFINSVGEEYLDDLYDNERTPKYYHANDRINYPNTFLRSCFISGDRFASEILPHEVPYVDELKVDNRVQKVIERDYLNVKVDCIYKGTARYELQENIIDQVDGTTIVKAPAGFGKTLLGLLGGFKTNKKIIWVCPRNFIAQSVYKSILSDLKALQIEGMSVELFLTGEVQEPAYRRGDKDAFNSDIIVTNIDNFLAPSVNNTHAKNLFLINNAYVVMDEYHELITTQALMAGFVNIMNVRHRIIKNNTVLLSATPTPMDKLWSGIKRSKILPSVEGHYPAAHDNSYKVNMYDKIPIDEMRASESNTLFKFNSIRNTQHHFVRTVNADQIIHSNYLPEDRNRIFSELLKIYGNKSTVNEVKGNVVGSHVIQASLDVSFKETYESIASPESTMQLIGRNNRWGTSQEQATINLFDYTHNTDDPKDPRVISERSAITTNYSMELTKKWIRFLRDKFTHKREIKLNELYSLYNEFQIKNETEIWGFIRGRYSESLKNLETIYPVKFLNKSGKGIINANGNKLRTAPNNKNLFVLIERADSPGNFTLPFNQEIYKSIGEDLNEYLIKGDPKLKIIKTYKHLMRTLSDSERLNYDFDTLLPRSKKHLDRITLDMIRRNAMKSNTPYVRYDKLYDPILGVIDKYREI